MRGKDPRSAWAMTQRFCGVCTTTHALCSIRSVEDALNVSVPVNAHMLRNLVMTMQSLQDHIVHFYHLTALDWVDIVSALSADPAKAGKIAESLAAYSPIGKAWPTNSFNTMKNAKDRLAAFVGTKNLGIYGSGYWGHKDMRLTPEINLLAFAHYLEALEYQRKIAEAVAIIGSKNPHIQNLTVGGVSTAINFDSMAALNMERVQWIKKLLDETADFVRCVYIPDVICVYIPDVIAIAGAYKDWFDLGKCSPNYIAVPDVPMNSELTEFGMKGGVIIGDKFREIKTWKDEALRNGVTENTTHAWYKNAKDTLHPYEGDQIQVLAGYMAGDPLVKKYVDFVASKVGVTIPQLNSVMGRNAARAIRALLMVDHAYICLEKLLDNCKTDQSYVNYLKEVPTDKEYIGVGFNEAPRGMLSHWIKIKNGVIENYSAVVPSTWTAGPRDDKGRKGPYEESLMNLPVAEMDKPLEVIRSIHSFDPCIACAVHTIDPEGKEVVNVKIR